MYEYKLITRHSELDSSLHINNANYLRYLEEARVSMMRDQNFPIQSVHDAGVEMILYKYVCSYIQQTRYPEKLTVKSKQIQTKKVRGILRQEIFRENNTVCFQADAYWAYYTPNRSQIGATHEFAKTFGQNQYSGIPLLNAEMESRVNESMPHFIYTLEVRPYEIDSFQHVNNAVYANYFEIARWDFRRKIFNGLDILKKNDLIFVLYKSTIRFLKPTFIFEKLFIKTWLIKLTPARIVYWQEIHDELGTIRASCRSEGCLVNNKGYPTKLLPEILLAYGGMMST